MPQPLSSHTLEPVLHNMRNPSVTTTESLYATAKTQCSQKKKGFRMDEGGQVMGRAETHSDTLQGPVGLLGIRPFCAPFSLIIGNSLHSASMMFPEFQWASSC